MTAGGVRVRLLGIGGVRGGARRGSCSFPLLVLVFVLVLLVDNHVKLLRSVHSGRGSAVRVAPDAGASAKGILWRWAPPEPLKPPPPPVNFDSDSASVLVGLRKWPERRRLRDLARQDRDLLSPDLGAPSDSRNNKRDPTPQFPPPGHAPTGGFAGCLLIKDDNHLLDEWLAYHSAVLPLRRLLIAIDPMSTQSPFAIIKKWNNTLNLTIDLWTDANYMHGVGLQRICNQWHETNLLKNHRSRQAAFMTSCARHMKEKGMDWTIMIDSDEYLIPNPIADDEEEPPTTLKSERHAKWREDLADARARLPPAITSNATLYDYILAESERGGADSAPWGQRRCILLPRLLFSAIESSGAENDELRELIGHHRIMADSLSTLRFYRHAGKSKASSRMFNKLAKPLLDLSRLDWESDLGTQFANPHNPIQACGTRYARFDESPFRVQHYLGSIDQYVVRGDVRRSKEAYQKKAELRNGISMAMRPWLDVFVEKVGIDRARELLKGAGRLPKEPNPYDICDGGNRTNVAVPLVPHYLDKGLKDLKKTWKELLETESDGLRGNAKSAKSQK